MRNLPRPNPWLPILAVLALAGAPLPARAQDRNYNPFDAGPEGWGTGGWGITHNTTWDGSKDAKNDPNSGSGLFEAEFTNGGEAVWQRDAGIPSLTSYKAFGLDVYVEPATSPGTNGTFGNLLIRLRPEGYAWPGEIMNFGALTNTGWNHLEMPLPVTATGFVAMNIHWTTTFTNTHRMWLDNLLFVGKPQAVVWKGFDTDNGGFGCSDWGIAHTNYYDASRDVNDNLQSGSLAVEAYFTTGGEVTLQTCSGLSDLSTVNKISMEVYIDPATPPGTNGHYGSFAARLRPPGWPWPGDLVDFGTVTNTGWTHLEKFLPSTATNFVGLDIHWNTGFTNTVKIWIDNIAFVPSSASTPPPVMAIQPSGPGLEVVTSGSGDYARKNVATVAALAPALPWINSTGAVTYAMTINENVEPGSSGYAANIMLIGTAATSINASPDWNEPHGIFLEAAPNNGGTLGVTVRYKTNAAGAHGSRFQPAGALIVLTNTGVQSLVGTWSLALQGVNVTLAGPGGISGSATLPADVPALFGPNLFALFGAQPYTRKDRKISLSRVRISGAADFTGAVDQDFTQLTALDPAFLEPKEEAAGGIRLKPTNTVWRLSWALPDAGFALGSTPTLSAPAWTLLSPAPGQQVLQGTRRTTYVTSTNVSGNQYYFRLQQ